MDDFEIESLDEADLTSPVLVEGLPGVGHVGKLAVEHLLEELESTPVRRVYSTHFPPQVTIDDEGVELASVTFHAVTPEAGRDLLVLSGDHQAQDGVGHYGLVDTILDIGDSFGIEEIVALGGVPTGELIEEYDVIGAATTDELIADLEAMGVEFRENEPAGGIVGVSGLLLGMGQRRGLPAACLMGETSGYLVDPKSAQAVLEVLQESLGFDVDYGSLEERADEMEEVARKIQEMEQGTAGGGADEDLRYIG